MPAVTTQDRRSIAFQLLGPVEVLDSGDRLPVGGDRQRALLGLLLLQPGRPVAADRLMDELWAGEPPDGAEGTLRSYISRLRKALDGHVDLIGSAAGYALIVDPEAIDAVCFDQLVREARQALEARRSRRAADQSGEALALWRGRPFDGLANDGALRIEAERLEELRIQALETRFDALLALGRSVELVDELEGLVREHPYRERFWRQLMLALYRSGRQADALAVYRRARTLLDRELGLEPSEELEQLQVAILRHEVPTIRPPEERHNLPAPLTNFIGREMELADVARLLSEARLVTLTGVGGVGKTRLALEMARRALPDFPDGVFLIDLSPLADGSQVVGQLASVLDVREVRGRSLFEQLGSRMRDVELMLVLDNCEHVRDAVADVASRLLAAAPRLRILATSREVLGVPGEIDDPVPPLGLPGDLHDEDAVRASEAVALFLARARAASPTLQDDAANLAFAARIVGELDGLPLAIELAAARAKALSLADISAKLVDRFRFLVSWRRLTAARHRTLREAMDWSYELLAPDEQALLARLSVFAGGFTLEAVAAVCLDGDEEGALRLVERLVDASLVVPIHVSGGTSSETRYRLLETVRQYGAEKLGERGETTQVSRRFASHFLELAKSANLAIDSEGDQLYEVVVAEQDNLRSALGWAIPSGDVELGLRIALALHDYWAAGRAMQAMQWFDELLGAERKISRELRAKALLAHGSLMTLAGPKRGSERYRESLAEFEALGDEGGRAHALNRLAFDAAAYGDLDRARALAEASLSSHRRVGNRRGEAQALGALGRVAWLTGDLQRAIDFASMSVAASAATGYWWGQQHALGDLADFSLDAGQPAEAEGFCRQALGLAHRLGDRQFTVFMFAVLARIAAEDGRLARAGLLWGALEAEEDRGAIGQWEMQRADYASRVFAHAGPGFEEGRAAGRDLGLTEAIERALHRNA